MIDLIEHSCVTPYLRIKGRTAGIENANHFPGPTAKPDGVAEVQSGISVSHIASDYEFGQPRVKKCALNHFDFAAYVEHMRGNAAHLHVGICPGGEKRKGSNYDHLWRDQRPAGGAGHTRRVCDDLDLVQGDAAVHL